MTPIGTAHLAVRLGSLGVSYLCRANSHQFVGIGDPGALRLRAGQSTEPHNVDRDAHAAHRCHHCRYGLVQLVSRSDHIAPTQAFVPQWQKLTDTDAIAAFPGTCSRLFRDLRVHRPQHAVATGATCNLGPELPPCVLCSVSPQPRRANRPSPVLLGFPWGLMGVDSLVVVSGIAILMGHGVAIGMARATNAARLNHV